MFDVVLLSGGFDPVHVGHVKMIQEAAKIGEIVVIGVNSDDWLARKKGKPFMKSSERLHIMQSLKGVAYSVSFDDTDNSACDLIKTAREKYGDDVSIAFANGGDRIRSNIPEVQTCLDAKVQMIWNVGGGKIQSSSDLIKNSQHD
jgi:D-beta-D-heptose 7-phosphate kinase/D-beta-D-heptose 1-phosphate adenosyltransferase